MATEHEEESDQLPEEGPTGQVPEDDSTAERSDAKTNTGGADEGDSKQATGNPKNAGQDG